MVEEKEQNTNQSASPEPPNLTGTPGTGVGKRFVRTSSDFIKSLFADGNECITAPEGILPLKEEMRLYLALFSNGRFLVAEPYKHDGRVLSFQVLVKKRNLQIGEPEYVSMAVLNDVYEHVKNRPVIIEDNNEDRSQVRMQQDFVTIIAHAAKMRVSDIHIIVAEHTTVMFRVNGMLQTEMEYNNEWGEAFVRAAFASADISDSNYAQNEYQSAQKLGKTPLRGSGGRLVLPEEVLAIRLQFNPIAFGSRYVVMRLLYSEEDIKTENMDDNLLSLGFTKRDTEIFYKLRSVPVGMILISGPTGSGKSTTLQRNMINLLKERNYEINLLTVEDPPEYPILGARQMPVTNAGIEEEKEVEFTKALAAALRSDPDIIMIGEIRTLSAADLAFRGALSGHGVWSTVHANSAPAILVRLRDMGVDEFKLRDPSLMRGLMAQRLFRTLCPYCRVPIKKDPTSPLFKRVHRALGDIGVERSFVRGTGCPHCEYRGVSGRTVVGEFILPDANFLDLMLKGETKKAINYWLTDLDGMTLKDNAIGQMLEGRIDIEEIERWTGFIDEPMVY